MDETSTTQQQDQKPETNADSEKTTQATRKKRFYSDRVLAPLKRYPQLIGAGVAALLVAAVVLLYPGGPISDLPKVDDWQYEEPQYNSDLSKGVSLTAESADGVGSLPGDTVGFSVGGAKDINSLRDDIANGYLPIPTDVTYEGIFYDYLFDTGQREACEKLFCPSFTTAVSADPLSKDTEYFMSVGLNSNIKQEDFARKKLNVVIALDISGSMSSSFNEYYYDQFGNRVEQNLEGEDATKSKMQIANEAANLLIDKLNKDDSFGMVLFDGSSYLAKPLREVGDTNMSAIKRHILEIEPQGSTNMSAGMNEAIDLFGEFENADKEEYENRVIFITDAQPNTGELSEEGLVGIADDAAERGIYTSFIGVGLDFNTELTEKITEIRGANYYSVHSPQSFKQRMDEGFDYMVTPLVFNLELTVEAAGFEIMEVYGSPTAEEATGTIFSVETLFPSESSDGETRGGIIVLHMKKISDDTSVTVKSSYEDRNGVADGETRSFDFTTETGSYDNTGIRKAILLSRYVNLLKAWMISERAEIINEPDVVSFAEPADPSLISESGIPIIEIPADSRWEQKSVPLRVSGEYVQLFKQFNVHFSNEIEAIKDNDLQQEITILETLSNPI